ncbi:MAG: alpha-ketoacid dehydrogenase subunit beta, partial [Chloroflexi bacterium]|nr:alpha-ketoacid dehydrogenase subunit beta [Chloroflexota bacterium]
GEALQAADELAGEGISVEVVDPRTLVPMDAETIRASVRKTGRVVIVDEACLTGSAAAEITALITEDPATFRALKAPPKRVCAPDVPIPYSPVMERFCLPDKDNVIQGIKEVLAAQTV